MPMIEYSSTAARSKRLPSARRWSGIARKTSNSDEAIRQPPIRVVADRFRHFRSRESPRPLKFRELNSPGNDAQLNLLNGPSEGWFLTTVHLPAGWCNGQITVAAHSVDAKYAIGLGTPFKIGRITWAAGGRLGVFLAAILVFSLTAISTIPII